MGGENAPRLYMQYERRHRPTQVEKRRERAKIEPESLVPVRSSRIAIGADGGLEAQSGQDIADGRHQ